MARTRSVKPDFFLDYELDQLSEAHQKLFVGLWCLADKSGKFLDEPRKVKAQVFPYRDYDVDEMLGDLHEAGFIHRYMAGDRAVIKVLRFEKHQRPHPKEPVLDLPEPTEPWKKTASREKKRQEINENNPSGRVPRSVPPLAGSWSLVLGSYPPGTPSAPGVGETGELVDGLCRIYQEEKGQPFTPPVEDQRQAEKLLANGTPEILRRWRIALRADYPRCWSLGLLAKHWAAYAKEEQPSSRKDIRKDPLRAEDMKHSEKVGEINDF